jgi:adenine C2-methylase RlmN of 23S rRNA A2503 and tRNA A37
VFFQIDQLMKLIPYVSWSATCQAWQVEQRRAVTFSFAMLDRLKPSFNEHLGLFLFVTNFLSFLNFLITA